MVEVIAQQILHVCMCANSRLSRADQLERLVSLELLFAAVQIIQSSAR